MAPQPNLVLTLTMNPSLDKSTETGRVSPNRKLRCQGILQEPGGGGINVSRVLRRLGQSTTAAYVCGGARGNELARLLEEEDVAQCPIPIESPIRESLMVMETISNQQYRFSFPGPRLEASEVERCIAAMRALAPESRVIVLSGSLPPGVPSSFYGRLITELASENRAVVLDTSGEALKEALGSPVFLIKPNLGEFEDLVGKSLPDDRAIADAARRLIDESSVEHVVVSLGAGGVAVSWGDRFERIASPTVPIRSRVGAGDSAVAGMAYGLAHKMNVYEAAQLGVAAGAATVMSPGTHLCRSSDVERLYRDMTGRVLSERGRSG